MGGAGQLWERGEVLTGVKSSYGQSSACVGAAGNRVEVLK